MNERFLGVPTVVWSALCLVVAVVFAVVWPRDRVGVETGARALFLLRWGHSLVWAGVALSLFARAVPSLRATPLPTLLGLAALALYLAFLVTLVRTS